MSRRAPKVARLSNSDILKLPRKRKASGYSSTMRDKIGIENNASNVRQRMRVKHSLGNADAPNAHEMILAAQGRFEDKFSEKCSSPKHNPSTPKKRKNENSFCNTSEDASIRIRESLSDNAESLLSNTTKGKHCNSSPEIDIVDAREMIDVPRTPQNLSVSISANTAKVYDCAPVDSGSVIEMFWKQDLRLYQGTIESTNLGVCIKCDDGDEEEIENIAEHVWKIICCNLEQIPAFENDHIKIIFENCMTQSASCVSKDIAVSEGPVQVKAADFLSLRDGLWEKDVAIEAFFQELLLRAVNGSSNRTFLISSLFIPFVQSGSVDSRNVFRKAVRGFESHSVDTIL